MQRTMYFRDAEPYNIFKIQELRHVKEDTPQYTQRFRWSERHLQCIWFDEKHRPSDLTLSTGEKLTVLSPGRWNLEAGPDFLNAELRIDPGARIVRGDIEVHIHPSDWDSHGHSGNTDYDNVVLHVCWFNSPPARGLPQTVPQLSLSQPVRNRPWFTLDDIDIKAYPHNTIPHTQSPCWQFLSSNPDYAEKLLRSAGYHRIQNKTISVSRRLEDSADREQVFYEEIMAALGYKQNKSAFRALAAEVPVHRLTDSREENLALMLGHAGLLPDPDTVHRQESAAFIRRLWDIWWKNGTESEEAIEWTLHGLRPNNHPTRRIAAAAALFTSWPDLIREIDSLGVTSGKKWINRIPSVIRKRTEWPFWNRQLLFSSTPDENRHYALLGRRRISAILTNALVPFYAAESGLPADTFDHLPPEDISSPMKTAAWLLFGRDHNPALYRNDNILQQGLLQIYLDFCLPAKNGCEGCRLLRKIEKELNV
ncbi:MAG: DUF2851 family protein [Kiritimatiellia bacterium]